MQQWTSAQWDVSLTQLPGLKHLSPRGGGCPNSAGIMAPAPPGPSAAS